MTTATELKTRILSKADEDGDFRAHLVLPPSPALTEAELATVAGGKDLWDIKYSGN